MAVDNDGIVQRVIDVIWNQGNLEVADVLFADDYVNHGGLITDLVRGPEAIKVSVALYRRAFPDLYVEAEELTAEGAAVVIHWTAHSRPPLVDCYAGAESSLKGITRCRLESGRIAESWTTWDSKAALDGLGIIAPMGARMR